MLWQYAPSGKPAELWFRLGRIKRVDGDPLKDDKDGKNTNPDASLLLQAMDPPLRYPLNESRLKDKFRVRGEVDDPREADLLVAERTPPAAKASGQGPMQRVRHPQYVGAYTTIVCGWFLAFPDLDLWYELFFWTGTTFFHIVISTVEQKVAKFGANK